MSKITGRGLRGPALLGALLTLLLTLSACGGEAPLPTATTAPAAPTSTAVPPTATVAQPTSTPNAASSPAEPSPQPGVGAEDIAFVYNGSLALINADGSGLRVLVQGTNISQPRWSPDGSRIVYALGSGSGDQLFVVDTAGKSTALPHQSGLGDDDPRWAPDGKTIAFVRAADKDGDSRLDGLDGAVIWLVGADGSTPHKLADGFDPAWAPDGKRIAFAAAGIITGNEEGPNTIDMINVEGQNRWSPIKIAAIPQDTSLIDPQAQFNASTNYLRYPEWAPKGDSIVFNAFGHSGLIVTASDKGAAITLHDFSYEGGYRRAHWSPDATKLAYEDLPPSGINRVVVLDLASKKRILWGDPQSGLAAESPSWSPDGTRIALIQNPQGGDMNLPAGSLIVSSTDGSGALKVIVETDAAQPDWR